MDDIIIEDYGIMILKKKIYIISYKWNNNSYLKFGMKYKICTIENPAILILNEKFKKDIEKFKKRISKYFLPTSVIEIVLYNAIITYFEK